MARALSVDVRLACAARRRGDRSDVMPIATVIDRHALAIHQGKVVKAAAYAQLAEARQCLERARRYAEAIKENIDAEAEQARKAGYDAGVAQAKDDFARRMASVVMRLESAHIGLEARLVNTVMQALETTLGTLDE